MRRVTVSNFKFKAWWCTSVILYWGGQDRQIYIWVGQPAKSNQQAQDPSERLSQKLQRRISELGL